LPHAQEAVALAPDSADAHAELGRIQAALGQLGPAAESFARALALGGDPGVERELGDTLVRLGRFRRRAAALRRRDRARSRRRRARARARARR
jgi:tetratricopeptide (TPR) repeat protein